MAMYHVLYLIIAHLTLDFNHILSLLIGIRAALPLPLYVLIKQLIGIVRSSLERIVFKATVAHAKLIQKLIMLLLFFQQPLFVERGDGL